MPQELRNQNIDNQAEKLLLTLIANADNADSPKGERYWLDQIGATIKAFEAVSHDGFNIKVGRIVGTFSTRSDDELRSFIMGYHAHSIPIDGDTSPRENFLEWIQNCALRHAIFDPRNGMDQFHCRLKAIQSGSNRELILI